MRFRSFRPRYPARRAFGGRSGYGPRGGRRAYGPAASYGYRSTGYRSRSGYARRLYIGGRRF